ncbi:PAS domain-containing sensor histidine kinase [Flavobacteriaceae bacterium 14752]|uniref:PAS domain-containing sensor histidine kinase n=1 Tax=Mesohalobacter salilacus TaxID=2491711 RepID=UPI000F644500|nr:PAS domain-containing sensor histidine kinase [Flavobacteriaceae bacterium 14752]
MKSFTLSHSEVFSILFSGISEGALIVNKSQQIVELNSSAAQMFGYEIDELKDQHINVLIPKNFHHKHESHVKSFIKKDERRQMGKGRNIFGLKKSGETFPVEAGLNPFEIEGEKFVMTLITDITKRVKTEKEILNLNASLEDKVQKRTKDLKNSVEELSELNELLKDEIMRRKKAEARIKTALQKERELNDLKTKFLSLVSHEFKTPLSGILTSSTLAKKYTKTEQQDKRDKHLNTIKNKVHYLTSILNDFLSVERLETGKFTYKFDHFSLLNLINEVVYNANVTLKTGQIINYPQDLDDVELYQDRNVLELILSNLLNNAIKYSKEDTTITLDISFDDKYLNFKISDEGIGIPEKDQQHIFERYFRAENALLNQGTGIGLNIIKVHLDNLGGDIFFESQENKGSTFFIKLPIKHDN